VVLDGSCSAVDAIFAPIANANDYGRWKCVTASCGYGAVFDKRIDGGRKPPPAGSARRRAGACMRCILDGKPRPWVTRRSALAETAAVYDTARRFLWCDLGFALASITNNNHNTPKKKQQPKNQQTPPKKKTHTKKIEGRSRSAAEPATTANLPAAF